MPYVMAEGYVILDISIDGGAYNWKGKFFVGESILLFDKVSKCVLGTHGFELYYLVFISSNYFIRSQRVRELLII